MEDATSGPDPAATSASVTVVPLGPDASPGQDLAGALEGVTGTTVRRLGGLGDFAAVSLRGSSFRQVEVFLDGVPLNPDGTGAVDLSELPSTAFSRVEVYRGNAPAAFGSSAMGGVVNLVTEEGAVPTALGVAAGSWGTAHAWGVAGPALHPDDPDRAVETLLAVDQLATQGNWPWFDDRGTEFNLFDDRTRERENNAIARTSAVGRVRFGPSGARVTLLDAFARSHQELPGPVYAPATAAAFGATRNLLSAGVDVRPAPAWRIEPRAWWLARREDFDDRLGELNVGGEWTRDDHGTLGAQTETTWAPAAWVVGSALVRGRRDAYAPTDRLLEREGDARHRLAGTAALSAQLRFLDERLLVAPVLQAEAIDNRGLGTDAVGEAWILPRAGALLKVAPGLALKANAGLYARPPDFLELFGDRGTAQGNPDLVAEHGSAWDVGVRAERHREPWLDVALDVAYARNRSADLIVWVQNSQYTQTPLNVGDAYVRSTEAALQIGLLDAVSSATALTWTLSRNLLPDPAYADKQLPRLPALEVSQRTALRWGDRVELAHTWSYTAATWLDAANTQSTAPRDLHGVALRVRPVAGLPAVQAEVLNLFDVRGMAVDRNPFSDDDDTLVVKPLADFGGYPLPGRTAMVAVTWTDSPGD